MKKIISITFLVLTSLYCRPQTIKHYTDGIDNLYYTDCKQDEAGNIWFAGWKGISKWDGSKFTFIKEKNPRFGFYGHNFLLDSAKNIMIYNRSSGILFRIQDNLLQKCFEYAGIVSDYDGNIWGIDGKSLYRCNGISQEKIFEDFSKSVESLKLDSNGHLWAFSNEGIYYLKNMDYIGIPQENGFVGKLISSLFEDSKGKIWITTRGKGVYCYSDKKWIVYTKEDSLFSDDVLQIAEDKNGRIWTAHYKAGISYFDGNTWTADKIGSGFRLSIPLISDNGTHTQFYSFLEIDNLGNVWFACYGGDIFKYNGSEWEKIVHLNDQSTDFIMYNGKFNKNYIWLKSRDKSITMPGLGLYNYDLRTNKLTKITNANVYEIAEGTDGVMWFITEKGLFKFDEANGYTEVIEGKRFSQINNTKSLLLDKQGNVWVGFKDGIYCVSKL